MSMSVTRYLKKSLVESPYIVVSCALLGFGIGLPTIAYFNGGKQEEAANRFNLMREIHTNPRTPVSLTPTSSQEEIAAQAKAEHRRYLAERRAAKGE